jgi:acetyl esterase/lipase
MNGYDARLRPPQPPIPAADAFEVHRAQVDHGLSLAYLREGVGGYPLLLIHGYPETKRIWWRNIEALAAAGYEVIVPDLRGHGESDLSSDDSYDIVTYSRDLHRLCHDVLGHERIGVVGGDVGGVVAIDMINRFDGFVEGLCFFDTVPPILVDDLVAAGIDVARITAIDDSSPTADYRRRQGREPDALAAELSTAALRRHWVASMYRERLWASPGTFSEADIDFMTEPWADEARLRAGWAVYQMAHGRQPAEWPILDRKIEVPTLLFYGADDSVVGPDFMHCCEVAFSNRVGPFPLPAAGHFLQWERADLFNPTVSVFFAGLAAAPGTRTSARAGTASLWPPAFEGLRAEARERAAEARAIAASRPMPVDPEERLRARRAMVASMAVPSPDGVDETIAGVPCRRFRPMGDPRGLYLHMHGGAMTLGSPLLNDRSNELIARNLGVEVVSVGYRLAPEHPHPAAVDDCAAVAEALVASSSLRVVIGGESAGAYLAVMTLLRLRDHTTLLSRVCAANLTCGPYDLSGTPSNRGVRPSAVREINDPDPPELFRSWVLPGLSLDDIRNENVSPLYADLHEMPPALFTVGSADRLLDDSLFMARRWQAYGGVAELAVYPDCGHTFSALPMRLAHIANDRITSFLRRSFH